MLLDFFDRFFVPKIVTCPKKFAALGDDVLFAVRSLAPRCAGFKLTDDDEQVRLELAKEDTFFR